jgi:hypothetical protein
MDKEKLLKDLHAANKDVLDAETQLATLLRELQGGIRAEKVTMSKALEEAIVKLRSARRLLESLEKPVAASQ